MISTCFPREWESEQFWMGRERNRPGEIVRDWRRLCQGQGHIEKDMGVDHRSVGPGEVINDQSID